MLRLIFIPLRRGEVPSSSALDSPSVISKLATPPHAINPDMSQVIDDATSTMNDCNSPKIGLSIFVLLFLPSTHFQSLSPEFAG